MHLYKVYNETFSIFVLHLYKILVYDIGIANITPLCYAAIGESSDNFIFILENMQEKGCNGFSAFFVILLY